MHKTLSTATAAIAAVLGLADPAAAQLAGSTALGDRAIGGTRVALGWSGTSTTLGERGFIGGGDRHVVTSAIAALRGPGARIVMPVATLDPVRTMPRLGHSDRGLDRARLVASSENNIAKDKVAEWHMRGADAGKDLEAAESRLAKFQRAGLERWIGFQADLSAAAARLRKAIGT